MYYKNIFLTLFYFTESVQTLTTTITNYNDYYNKYYYKKVGLDNEIYRCGMDRVCNIDSPIYSSYDNITNSNKRMDAIVDLVLELNSRTDFRDMIDSCREIVEHNFNTLKTRRPEENMLNVFCVW